ncbi:MAG: CBS domain-containing protein [Verrucomicrobia bacterium]|nr:CBS domain-containing protein [Cytophagales bacterium]
MELYLDSVDFKEIEEAAALGIITGVTTTPTFMHRHGIKDIDGAIIKLSKMVNILQIEALGDTADQMLKEAYRQLDLGLDKDRTVFKMPVSNEAIKACKRMTDEGLLVNIHLVYTLQQAYMAMLAGATYVCPLVGRLQDEGHDALGLIEQCVDMVDYYEFDTNIMFSSVRHAEHVRNAINLGVHTITVPWNVMKKLTDNNFTKVGTQQFVEHTRLMTVKAGDVLSGQNPTVSLESTVLDAIVKMTESGAGAVAVVDNTGKLTGIFTDGDLRRLLQSDGKDAMQKKMNAFDLKMPIFVAPDALLYDAMELIKKNKIDNLVVVQDEKPIGLIDVQDLV